MEEAEYLKASIRALDEQTADLEALKERRAALVRALCAMSAERRRKPSSGKAVEIIGPDGTRYPTQTAAARAAGVTDMAMRGRIVRGLSGWRRADAEVAAE